MFRNGIIFLGLLVATSAAGFGISLMHGSFSGTPRTAALSPDISPIAVQDTTGTQRPVAAVAPTATTDLPQKHLETTPPPAADASLATANQPIGHSAIDTAPPLSVSEQTARSAMPVAPVPLSTSEQPEPLERAAHLPAIASAPTPAPGHGLRVEHAPLAMNLPVHSHAPNRAHSAATPPQDKTGPAPRYLIGVYR